MNSRILSESGSPQSGKISIEHSLHDSILKGTFRQGSAVILCSPTCPEAQLLISEFLMANDGAAARLYICTRKPPSLGAVGKANKVNEKLVRYLVCSENVPESHETMVAEHGLENLTTLSVSIAKAVSTFAPTRVSIDILSDLLLQYGPTQIRKWLSEQLNRFRANGITTLALLNSEMHSTSDMAALTDLFDGNLEISEARADVKHERALFVKWMHGMDPSAERTIYFDDGPRQQIANRIAVLPFSNLSPDPSNEYFADGMTDELIDRLSQIKQLRVIARTSVMNYKNKEKALLEIGKELAVSRLVEGSVRIIGDKIRITAQLIDAATEEHLWSSRFDRNLNDILSIQTEIASEITKELAGALAVSRIAAISRYYTDNFKAYSFFLQSRQLIGEHNKISIMHALELLEKAIELDGSFARAFTEIARCYSLSMNFGLLSKSEALEKAKSAANRALELQNLPEAHEALSNIAWIEDKFDKAEEEAMIAIELNPNDSYAYMVLGLLKARSGYPDEAIRFLETAHLLDPLSRATIRHLSRMYIYRGKKIEARELLTRNLRVAPQAAMEGFADLYLIEGDLKKAEESICSLELDFPEQLRSIALRGELEALKGNGKAAKGSVEILVGKYKAYEEVYNAIALIRYLMGDMDGFFDAIDHSFDSRSQDTIMLMYHPLIERARKDPRFGQFTVKA